MLRNLLYSLISFLVPFALTGQQESSLILQDFAWQSNKVNPANFPTGKKFYIGLPGIHNHSFLTGENINDFKVKQADGDNVIDMDRLIATMEADNQFHQYVNVETISFGFNAGRLKLAISHDIVLNGFMNYPKTLPQLVWQGNAQFIGETVAFSPKILTMGYHELGLGIGFEVAPQINIGVRAKYLNGFGSFTSENESLTLTTSVDNYELELGGQYQLNSSNFLRSNGLWDYEIDLDQVDDASFFTGNHGYAVDLGIHAKLNQITFMASVLDIGSITWSENPSNYSLSGPIAYQGLDALQDALDGDSNIGSVLDTLQQIYEPTESQNEFKTTLPLRALAGIKYDFNNNWTVAAAGYAEKYRDEWYASGTVNVQREIAPWWRAGISYGYRNKSFNNVGVQTFFNLGPVQVLATTENVLSLFNTSGITDLQFRVGANIAFGRIIPSDYNQIEHQDDFF